VSAPRRSQTEARPERVGIVICGVPHAALSASASAEGGMATSRMATPDGSVGAPPTWSANAARNSTVAG
jgi:hypothetical protein